MQTNADQKTGGYDHPPVFLLYLPGQTQAPPGELPITKKIHGRNLILYYRISIRKTIGILVESVVLFWISFTKRHIELEEILVIQTKAILKSKKARE